MFGPAGTLARSVAIMGKFALAAPLQLVLSAETGVANALGQAAEERAVKKGGEVTMDVSRHMFAVHNETVVNIPDCKLSHTSLYCACASSKTYF